MTDPIRRIEVTRVEGRLPARAENARLAWTTRAGWRVRLEDAAGRVGRGEAAPLPGYSKETLTDVDDAIGRLSLDDLPAEPAGANPAWPATVRFAVQTALYDLAAQRAGRSVAALLGAPREGEGPPVTGLVSDVDPADAQARARALVAGGVRHLKVKIGRPGAWDAERRVLGLVQGCLPSTGTLRVDANRALPTERLPARLAELAALGVALAEEPAPPDAVLAQRDLPVPIAVDETLAEPGGADYVAALGGRGALGALVLKPAVLGIDGSLAWAARARALGADVSLSHLVDGPVAHRVAASLAWAVGGGAPQGLGPHGGLDALSGDGWPRPWPIEAGRLVAPVEPGLGGTR